MRASRILPAALALAAAAVAAPSPAASGIALTDCREAFLAVAGDAEAVRAAVPEGFTPTGALVPAGSDLFSITSTCRSIVVGGRSVGAGTLHLLGASVQAPVEGGTEPLHQYLLAAATDVPALAWTLRRSGVPIASARGTTSTLDSGLALGHLRVDVPIPGNGYRFTGSMTPLTTHPHAHDASWWFTTRAGRARLVVHHAESAENAGDCSVATDEGTRLARLLGGVAKGAACFVQAGVSGAAETLRG